MDLLANWLSPEDFMPHGHCYLWTPSLLWTYVISDSVIGLAYYTIPLALLYFVRKRVDLQFNWIFVMFSIFIFACGTTHLVSILTIWKPAYWLDASLKAFTAVASGITGILLWQLLPKALQLPSTQQLRDTVAQLEHEIKERRAAETALARMNETLESRVAARTAELTHTNRKLLDEVQSRKQAQQAIFEEKQRALVTLESIGDAVITTDTNSRVTYLNPVAEKLTGWPNGEAKGKPISEVFQVVSEITREPVDSSISLALANGTVGNLPSHSLLIGRNEQEYLIEDSAAPIRDHEDNILGVVLVFHDVSNARKMAYKMTYLAQHDFLTELPNRVLLTDRLTQALSQAKRTSNMLGLMFLDIDHFKQINDTLGNEAGDELLRMVGRNLQKCLRNSDTVSRQEGDEFMILLPDVTDDDATTEVAARLVSAVASDYVIGTHEVTISASIGIAVYPQDGNNANTLIKHADAAMRHAKKLGRNNFQFFTPR